MAHFGGGHPKLLIATTVHWASTTRLALTLSEAGFRVAAVAPADHALHRMAAVAEHRVCAPHSGFIAAVEDAMASFMPDLVVPGDDRAVRGLHQLYTRAMHAGGPAGRAIASTLHKSLGDPAFYPVAERKTDFIAFCQRESLPIPETVAVSDRGKLSELIERLGLPLVLKVDGSWGGLGTRVAQTAAEAMQGFDELSRAAGWRWAARRTLEEVSTTPLFDRLRGRSPAITVQRFVDGPLANRSVLCRDGAALAGITVEAVQLTNATGPATVIRVLDQPEIGRICRWIVRELGLSGFVGFDFVIDRETGKPWLLELNPRPTQTCHLRLSQDSDMVGALAMESAGIVRRPSVESAASRVIALYPQEMWRDPASDYLRTAHHDVPWHQPQFIDAYARPVPADTPSWLQIARRRLRLGALRPRLPALDAAAGEMIISPKSTQIADGG